MLMLQFMEIVTFWASIIVSNKICIYIKILALLITDALSQYTYLGACLRFFCIKHFAAVMAMKWKSRDFNVELEVMHLWSQQQLIKKKVRKLCVISSWILLMVLKNRENVIYTKPKLKPCSVVFFYEYILVKFILWSQSVTMSWT
jgi:hypothetical protein